MSGRGICVLRLGCMARGITGPFNTTEATSFAAQPVLLKRDGTIPSRVR